MSSFLVPDVQIIGTMTISVEPMGQARHHPEAVEGNTPKGP